MYNLDPALEFCSEFMEIVKPNCSVEGEIKFTCGGLKKLILEAILLVDQIELLNSCIFVPELPDEHFLFKYSS